MLKAPLINIKVELGLFYKITFKSHPGSYVNVRLIKTTDKAYNFLILATGKCLFKRPLYKNSKMTSGCTDTIFYLTYMQHDGLTVHDMKYCLDLVGNEVDVLLDGTMTDIFNSKITTEQELTEHNKNNQTMNITITNQFDELTSQLPGIATKVNSFIQLRNKAAAFEELYGTKPMINIIDTDNALVGFSEFFKNVNPGSQIEVLIKNKFISLPEGGARIIKPSALTEFDVIFIN